MDDFIFPLCKNSFCWRPERGEVWRGWSREWAQWSLKKELFSRGGWRGDSGSRKQKEWWCFGVFLGGFFLRNTGGQYFGKSGSCWYVQSILPAKQTGLQPFCIFCCTADVIKLAFFPLVLWIYPDIICSACS